MMNSFNHYSLGSVAQWLYEYVAGIRLDPERPGYEHVVIAPTPGALEHARADVPLGARPDHGAPGSAATAASPSVDVEIPANVTATVVLPGAGDLTEGGVDASTAAGVRALRRENGTWMADIGSGSYDFRVASSERELVGARPGAEL